MNRYSTVNGEWSQKVVNSSLAPPLGSVLDNSGVQREGPIYDLLLPTLFGQVEPIHDELCDLVSLTSAKWDLGKPEAPQ